MSALSEAYAGIKSLFDADSGGTGLNNSSSDAYVKSIARLPDERAGSMPQVPYLGVTLTSAARLRSHGSTGNIIRVDMTVVTEADRDQSFREDDIVSRLRTVFDGQTITGSTWAFTQLEPISQSPQSPQNARTDRPFTVSYEMAGFSDGTAALMGAEVSLTNYTGGKCFSVSLNSDRQLYDMTTAIEASGLLTSELGDKAEGGVMRFYVTGAPPADGLKTGVVINLSSSVSLTGDIKIHKTRLVATVGQAQIYEAQYVVNGELS